MQNQLSEAKKLTESLKNSIEAAVANTKNEYVQAGYGSDQVSAVELSTHFKELSENYENESIKLLMQRNCWLAGTIAIVGFAVLFWLWLPYGLTSSTLMFRNWAHEISGHTIEISIGFLLISTLVYSQARFATKAYLKLGDLIIEYRNREILAKTYPLLLQNISIDSI